MRLESIKGLAAGIVAAGLLLNSWVSSNSFGDEPSRLGRLFRMGSSGSNSGSNSNPTSGPASSSTSPTITPAPSYYGQPALSTPPSTTMSSLPVSPHIKPKARVNKPVTEADPLVTRISVGRSDNGGQFGMIMQVFADGTVIDGEGVHRVSAEVLKPVVEAVASGDLAKLRGHCGGPAGDFIENVHVIVFDRSLGRLRASSFSYSGNPQGCDHAVHHLQKVLEELQGKLSSTSPTSPNSSPNANANINAPSTLPLYTPALTTPALPLTSP